MYDQIPEDSAEETPEEIQAQPENGATDNRRTWLIIGLVALVAIVCIGGFLLYQAFFGPNSGEPSGSDEVWKRIQERGRMIVGVSSDYPPFEYLNKDNQLDGFDIALMREIGQKIGLPVEFQDISFDGLGAALQVGQVDIVISAISVTSDRQEILDFSNIYFVSEDAFLAREDSDISILSLDSVVGFRVGVQDASVFQNWLQSELVDSGKMAAANLISYQGMDQAIADLEEGFIQLLVMDLPPAEVAVTTGVYKISAMGLNQQRYGIAVPKGSSRLLAEINSALTDLQNEGRINELTNQYIGVDAGDILPIPTVVGPAPTPDPDDCLDAMAFVEDLSLGSSSGSNLPIIQPGQPFQKGWRVRNTGTCSWDSSYFLVYAGGNTPQSGIGGQPVAVQGTVIPDREYDFWVTLAAPLSPGTYVGFWSLESGRTGQLFGSRLSVAIDVPPPPTSTPVPTQTPTVGIKFGADPLVIDEGQCSTLIWETQNVKAVYLYPQGASWENYEVPTSGTQSVCPSSTTTYELRVVNLDDSVEVRLVTVIVNQNPNAPDIVRFTVDPPNQITVGECVLLQWVVEGDISNVVLTRDNLILWDHAPLNGSYRDCPPSPATVTYAIEAVGPGGVSRANRQISVVGPTATQTSPAPTEPPQQTETPNPPTATPISPTVPPSPPIIQAFTVQPNQITAGECVLVTWDVGGTVDLIQIFRNDTLVLDNAPFQGSEQDCLSESGNYVYRIEASNNSGGQDTAEASVIVSPSQPDNPLKDTAWKLLEIFNGKNLTPVIEGSEVTATFADGGRTDGSGGCNTYSASYTVIEDELNIENVSSTQILCSETPGLMEQEAAYFTILEEVEKFMFVEVDGKMELHLTKNGNDQEVEILVFEEMLIANPQNSD